MILILLLIIPQQIFCCEDGEDDVFSDRMIAAMIAIPVIWTLPKIALLEASQENRFWPTVNTIVSGISLPIMLSFCIENNEWSTPVMLVLAADAYTLISSITRLNKIPTPKNTSLSFFPTPDGAAAVFQARF